MNFPNMTLDQAYYIGYLRTGPIMHSWRRVAELMVERYPDFMAQDLSGNQLIGIDLCRDAFFMIYGKSMFDASRGSDPYWAVRLKGWE